MRSAFRLHAPWIAIGALLSCAIAFANRYPIVYPDTGTYLLSGFESSVPADRPVFYGLFLRHISLAATPWLPVLVQGLLASSMLYLTWGLFLQGRKRQIAFLASLGVLVLGTGYGYQVGILIPDLFASLPFLAVANLLFQPRLNRWTRWALCGLIVFSMGAHLSNIPIFGLLLAGLAFYSWKNKTKAPERLRRLIYPAGSWVLALLLIPTVNASLGGSFQLSRGSGIFMLNHLLEIGAVEPYLEKHCPEEDWFLCPYQDQLQGSFLWDPDSPLYLTGGWDQNAGESQRLVRAILSHPANLLLATQKGVEYTFRQFFNFRTAVAHPQLEGSAPYGQIHWRFRHSIREYLGSRQNRGETNLTLHNQVQWVLVLGSMLLLTLVLLLPAWREGLPSELVSLIRITWAFDLLSCAVCANASTVDDRFQNRIVWLLLLLSMVVLALWWDQKGKSAQDPVA